MIVRQALGKFREVFLAEKNTKKRCLSQLGIEEELVSFGLVKIVLIKDYFPNFDYKIKELPQKWHRYYKFCSDATCTKLAPVPCFAKNE